MADYLTDAFIRLRQRLKWISGRILPDADGAEDILQDSFVRLWRRQYPLQSEKEAEALLTRTVRNASLNERRRARSVPLERDLADNSPDTLDVTVPDEGEDSNRVNRYTTIHPGGERIRRKNLGRYSGRIGDGTHSGKDATLPRPQNT